MKMWNPSFGASFQAPPKALYHPPIAPMVTARKSGYNLSVEEEEAIRQAMAGPREAVKAR